MGNGMPTANTQLGALEGWHLLITCRGCRQMVQHDAPPEASEEPEHVAVVWRLRCRRCGKPPVHIEIADATEFTGHNRPVRRLALMVSISDPFADQRR